MIRRSIRHANRWTTSQTAWNTTTPSRRSEIDVALDDHGRDYDRVHEYVDARDDWARRRRKGTSTDENLSVVACMAERTPVESALGLELGGAQVYHNAGGKVN